MKPDMIQATVEGRKTNTRRLEHGLKEINREPDRWEFMRRNDDGRLLFWKKSEYASLKFEDPRNIALIKPRYQVGETVYIKEAHYRYGKWVKNGVTKTGKQRWLFVASSYTVYYSDNPPSGVKPNSYRQEAWYKRSPLFMPEWAARHFITILAVRAERLQGITEEDAKAEGVESQLMEYADWPVTTYSYRWNFPALWNSLNPKYPWESNPWVFPYEFELMKDMK